ncbi:MAG: 30S ribosomal protein S8 [Clostridiales bacterium]|jgi:small subunit ribosomal protein S8|nr:30S ribosomal protein S8 [Clostridiales bacterium]
MSMSDPIADMLTRIRNANSQRHATVDVPVSRIKTAIADILIKEGYVKSYEVIADGVKRTMRISLKYGPEKDAKVISGIRRISKPGLRVYTPCEKLPKVLGGLGTAIVSTNKGLVTDKEARKLGVGGEVIAFVW